MRHRFSRVVWIAVYLTVAAPLWAQEDLEAAAQLFRAGQVAYDQGEYAAAARSFELAYSKAPRTPAIFAAAVAWESAGNMARGATAFRAAVEAGDLPPEDAKRAKERLTALTARLAQLRVVAESDTKVLVGRLMLSDASDSVFLNPGRHVVVFELPDGTTSTHTVQLDAGASATIDGDEPRVAPAVTETTTVTPSTSVDGGMERGHERTFAWIALGGATVALGASAYLGSQAVSARDAWEADPSMANLDERDRAASLRGWTNVCLATTAALGTVGVVLFVSSAPDGREVESASVGLQPGGGSFLVRF